MTTPHKPHTSVGIHLPSGDFAEPVDLRHFLADPTGRPFISVVLGDAHLYVHRPGDFDFLASLFTRCAGELRRALADIEVGQECDGCPGLFPVAQMEPIGTVVLCPACRTGALADAP